jgi:protein SMG8
MVSSAKKKQIKYEFQTFKPSSADFKADEAQEPLLTTQPFLYSDPTSLNLSQEEQFPKLSKQSNANPIQNPKRTDNLFPSPLLNENKLTKSKNLYTDSVATPSEENQASIANNQQSISPVRSNIMDSLKINNTLASTEVYLVGLLNSESKPGLLPLFSSWSLISIGRNTSYNPQTGLNQPGFLPNHNFLIPWEIVISKGSISSTDKQASKRNANFNKKNPKAPESGNLWSADQASSQPAPISIRAYIGMEYECPYGHRFICSGPDRIVKVSTNGNVKDDAYKLLNGDMPLYTACPCRNSKDTTPYMAQMMRVYIVTPSSAVNQIESNIDYKGSLLSSSPPSATRSFAATTQAKQPTKTSHLQIGLKPRVQPNPVPCPVFWPSPSQNSIYLTENSIWVLRLPYVLFFAHFSLID